jgi:aryl-alcohol dehydrogenase-like predicted oxidoreductase
METRRLGRTEHRSSVAILGGAAFWQGTPDEAGSAVAEAVAAGVNHLDVAPQYGEAERLVGPFIAPRRADWFVACKTQRKNPDGVRAQLENSLGLLGCDRFDLYQVHALISLADLDDRADAFETILRARDEGLTRFVGVTGHNVETVVAQAEAVRRYDLDTVMFPLNPRLWADTEYRRGAEALLALAAERDLGVMIIKAAAARPWTDAPRHATTWYEPYTDAESVARGVRFVLSTPGVHAFCTPGDVNVLRVALAAAQDLGPVVDREAAMAAVAHEPMIFPIPS